MATPDFETIRLQIADGIAILTLNRPDKMNSFTSKMMSEMIEAFDITDADDSVGAVIVTGAGDRAFCAGADLNWMRRMGANSWAENEADAARLAEMLWTLYNCPVPVVGRLHGDCYAGGLGLAAVCDLLVAAEGVHFCLSEARLGLLPATIGPYVVKALGEQASRRYFVSAERFSAAEAKALGFVHELVAPAELDNRLGEIVAALAANGPQALRACKRLVQDLAGRPIDAALRAETARRIADIRASAEGREGVAAFLDKRETEWR